MEKTDYAKGNSIATRSSGINPLPHLAPSLPFAHLNLRYNPFGALLPEERAQLAVIAFDLPDVVQRLHRPGHAIQFTGKKGRGKSTHLQAIRAHFPGAPFTYVPKGGPIPEVPDTPVQFIDEMQRIPFYRRRRIFRRHASFVIGSHWNHRLEFRLAGLTYELHALKGLDVKKLMAIIDKRISWAIRDPGRPVPSVSESAAANLIATYGDDIRAIEGHLYECFQAMARPEQLYIDPPTPFQRACTGWAVLTYRR